LKQVHVRLVRTNSKNPLDTRMKNALPDERAAVFQEMKTALKDLPAQREKEQQGTARRTAAIILIAVFGRSCYTITGGLCVYVHAAARETAGPGGN
jgi:CHASE3 domain sensor protein